MCHRHFSGLFFSETCFIQPKKDNRKTFPKRTVGNRNRQKQDLAISSSEGKSDYTHEQRNQLLQTSMQLRLMNHTWNVFLFPRVHEKLRQEFRVFLRQNAPQKGGGWALEGERLGQPRVHQLPDCFVLAFRSKQDSHTKVSEKIPRSNKAGGTCIQSFHGCRFLGGGSVLQGYGDHVSQDLHECSFRRCRTECRAA